jgi:hypothetical protein
MTRTYSEPPIGGREILRKLRVDRAKPIAPQGFRRGTAVATSPAMRPLHVAFAALLLASPAFADPVSDLDAQIAQTEAHRADAARERTRLEQESAALAKTVDALKAQPAGPVRDVKLQRALAEAQEMAQALDKLQAQLRTIDLPLFDLHKRLAGELARAAADSSLSAEKRAELARRRDAEMARLGAGAPALEIAIPNADAVDGPAELADKADLLKDSEDKLRREIDRLGKRIDGVEGRRRLRERAGAVDEDLFIESGTGRRVVHVGPITADKRAEQPTAGGAFSPRSNENGAQSFSDAAGGGGTIAYGASLRGVIDPSTLDELRRAEAGQDLDRQLRALRKMQSNLRGVADDLGRREADLRRRAGQIKPRKGP